MDLTDSQSLYQLSIIDADLAKILDSAAPPAQYPPLDEGRRKMRQHDKEVFNKISRDGMAVDTKHVAMRDGFENELQIFKPKNNATLRPLVVIFFGGGFMFGNNLQCANYASAICKLCGAVVVLPSYRLAPEFPFPTGPNDAWDALLWIAQNANSIGADPSQGFIIGGRSAGATLSAVIAQRSLLDAEYTGPLISGMWLNAPMLLTAGIVPEEDKCFWISREQNANAPFFNSAMVKALTETWKLDDKSPMFSPFNAGPEAHRGMPKTHFQICGADPLRDDALLYARVLKRYGVSTSMDVYPGLPHGVTNFYPELPASKKYQTDAVHGIGMLLGQDLSRNEIERVFPW